MRLVVSSLLAVALTAVLAPCAQAEVVLEGVHWQVGRVEHGRVKSWADVKVLQDGPPQLDSRLRARLSIKNRGPLPSEGILLRYSLTARLTQDGSTAGTWAIPFFVDERRVAKIGPNQVVEVPLVVSPRLELYLRRLSRAGWWPDRLRLQVMLEPHSGEQVLQSLEEVLEVVR